MRAPALFLAFLALSLAAPAGCGDEQTDGQAAGQAGTNAAGQGGTSGSAGGGGGSSGKAGSDPCVGRSCDDGIACTIDSCKAGECLHAVGPNKGDTACPQGQFCTVEKGCVSAPACATDAQCAEVWKADPCKMNPRCDAASSVCLFDPLDKDKDGHLPLVCGGDDCDDGDAQRHPGKIEACDGKDNNCDGEVDDADSTLCASNEKCQGGSCVCTKTLCDFSLVKFCADTESDVSNCGACGKVCPASSACKEGKCVCENPALTFCQGECVNTSYNPLNCGKCFGYCASGQCVGGVCECPPPFALCDGTCTDLDRNKAHCGACGKACPEEEVCSGGECGPKLSCADLGHATCLGNYECADGERCGFLPYLGASACCEAGERGVGKLGDPCPNGRSDCASGVCVGKYLDGPDDAVCSDLCVDLSDCAAKSSKLSECLNFESAQGHAYCF